MQTLAAALPVVSRAPARACPPNHSLAVQDERPGWSGALRSRQAVMQHRRQQRSWQLSLAVWPVALLLAAAACGCVAHPAAHYLRATAQQTRWPSRRVQRAGWEQEAAAGCESAQLPSAGPMATHPRLGRRLAQQDQQPHDDTVGQVEAVARQGASDDSGPVPIWAIGVISGAGGLLLVGTIACVYLLCRRRAQARVRVCNEDDSQDKQCYTHTNALGAPEWDMSAPGRDPSSGLALSLGLSGGTTVHNGSATFMHRATSRSLPTINGMSPGELFLRTTAHEYTWAAPVSGIFSEAFTEGLPVESGINDVALDALCPGAAPGELPSCPVVPLSRQQVQEQLQILPEGLLGKGATAVVFRCRWPARFGPHAQLAIKMLKDGFESDMYTLESFLYEARVLEAARHTSIVRMYGYCLEPPNVCIIMELLPRSLKALLYGPPLIKPAPSIASLVHGDDFVPIIPVSADEDTMLMAGTPSMARASSAASMAASMAALDPDTRVYLSVIRRQGPSSLVDSTDAASMAPTSVVDGSPLTIHQALQIAVEVAAGLAYLHSGDVSGGEARSAPGSSGPGSSHKAPQELWDADAHDVTPTATTVVYDMCRPRVVHRDLKPANILINSQGHAKISDFGLARQHTETTVHTLHLGAGTLPYMAPELVAGRQLEPGAPHHTTNRVDIYSLAMVMWEMLSGQPPWKNLSDVAIMGAVHGKRRPPMPKCRDRMGDVPPGSAPASLEVFPRLNALIASCWQQRDLRRPSAADVARQLCALLGQLRSGGAGLGPLPAPDAPPSSTSVAAPPLSAGTV